MTRKKLFFSLVVLLLGLANGYAADKDAPAWRTRWKEAISKWTTDKESQPRGKCDCVDVESTTTGAAIGAAVGAVGGALIGKAVDEERGWSTPSACPAPLAPLPAEACPPQFPVPVSEEGVE